MQPTLVAIVMPTPAPRHWRRLRRVVAVLLLVLTLAMPLICVAHCRITTGPDQPYAASAGDQAHFLCNLMPRQAGADLFVPAFWPGLPATLGLLLIALPLLRRPPLAFLLPASLAGWAPLTPPPR